MNKEENHEEELPKLNIKQENEFKKLKLNLEHGAIFPDQLHPDLPPEIESIFLDSIMNFENAYQNVKQISVFDKLGKPEFKTTDTLSNEEISIELDRIMDLMTQNGLALDVLCDYDDQDKLIYSFITTELFLHEINDMNVPGMVCNFIYEEFHQNHKYDLERETEDFLRMFLNAKSDFYSEFHSKDATNHEALNNFRSMFKKFKIKFFEIENTEFDDVNATVAFNIDFWGKIQGTEAKILYSGPGSMTFEYKYGYWYVREVNLPIND